jgi:hypothetical protein
MTKPTAKQRSMIWHAQAVREWRAKGWGASSVNRMLICALENTRSVHQNPSSDAVIVLEIADGRRTV